MLPLAAAADVGTGRCAVVAGQQQLAGISCGQAVGVVWQQDKFVLDPCSGTSMHRGLGVGSM